MQPASPMSFTAMCEGRGAHKRSRKQRMRHMTAAMVHGGGGVLLMMTTKFASQLTNKKYKS
jgi:hypothetical protein